MKLKNKKTGEIIDLSKGSIKVVSYGHKIQLQALDRCNKPIWMYSSLAELNEVWEDCEEPKKYFNFTPTLIDNDIVALIVDINTSREEAKKAMEKLKAWKRLKDKGFRFDGWTIDDGLRISICTNTDSEGIYDDDKKEMKKDLDLIFGGEE